MGISQATTIVMAFLTGLLPASCHKNTPPKTAPGTIITNTASGKAEKTFTGNLGKITLTNGADTCVRLANGESCTLTPKMLDRRNVQITLALEAKDSYGATRAFSVTQVTGETGESLDAVVGDLKLTFTPLVTDGK